MTAFTVAAIWPPDGSRMEQTARSKVFLLADMIGDADLDILRDEHSTSWLEDLVYEAARRLGYQSYFFAGTGAMEDDHMPFKNLGVPVADLIDFTYGYNNVYHHTTEDTIDKLSTKSLKISGDVILETIRLLNANADKFGPTTKAAAENDALTRFHAK